MGAVAEHARRGDDSGPGREPGHSHVEWGGVAPQVCLEAGVDVFGTVEVPEEHRLVQGRPEVKGARTGRVLRRRGARDRRRERDALAAAPRDQDESTAGEREALRFDLADELPGRVVAVHRGDASADAWGGLPGPERDAEVAAFA